MQLIDSHSHLDFPEFDSDRSDAIKRAQHLGVTDIIISSTTASRWPLVKTLVKENKSICHAAYGLHPMSMPEHTAKNIYELKLLLNKENAVAVGEIGLDFFIDDYDPEEQIKLFVSQLRIADEYGLPVIIHARKSLDIVIKYLRRFAGLRGSIHSFSGSEQQAKQLIDLGFYLSFGGVVTYSRATRLRKLVASLPIEALLLETDSPDQPDALHYGERNEPAYLLDIAQPIADICGITLEELAQATTTNAQTLFNL